VRCGAARRGAARRARAHATTATPRTERTEEILGALNQRVIGHFVNATIPSTFDRLIESTTNGEMRDSAEIGKFNSRCASRGFHPNRHRRMNAGAASCRRYWRLNCTFISLFRTFLFCYAYSRRRPECGSVHRPVRTSSIKKEKQKGERRTR